MGDLRPVKTELGSRSLLRWVVGGSRGARRGRVCPACQGTSRLGQGPADWL